MTNQLFKVKVLLILSILAIHKANYVESLALLENIVPTIGSLLLPNLGVDQKDDPPENPNAYRSYQNSVYCSASAPIHYPNSLQEVQAIVRTAIASGQTVKAFGSRHSAHDVICTQGVPVSMKNINYTRDNNDGTASFGAGIEVIHALEYLEARNKTLIHVPAYGGITLAGAMGTGAHGSSLRHPTALSDQIVSFTLVDGRGNITIIDQASGDLDNARVHLGLLGIIVEVTIKTVPLFKMRIENCPQPESILFDGTAVNWAMSLDWFELWWFPNLKQVVVSKGDYLKDMPPGNASTNMIPDQTPVTVSTTSQAYEKLQGLRLKSGLSAIEQFSALSLYAPVIAKPPIFTEDGITLKNPAVGYGWRMQSNKCTDICAWDNGPDLSLLPEEFSIAFDIVKFSAVFTMIQNVLKQYDATFPLLGILVRFTQPSNAPMSLASGRITFNLEMPLMTRSDPFNDAKDGLGAYQAILQEMVFNYGGRPHWGKNGMYYTRQSVLSKAISPANRQKFINTMKKYDPNGVFLNKFGRRILNISDEVDTDPKVTRCALQDYCVCSKDSDCAVGQKCSKINGFSVCKDVGLGPLVPWEYTGPVDNLLEIVNYVLLLP